jgi:CHAT domain-containing protein
LLDLLNDADLDFRGMRHFYLGSCESAVTPSDAADDLPGLFWAVSHGGAEAVMGTLWPVNDAAGKLMASTFYDAWDAGKLMLHAYQTATLGLRDSKDFGGNPFLWAPFVLAGNGFVPYVEA